MTSNGEDFEKESAYWKEKLKGLEPLELPSEKPLTARSSGSGAKHQSSLNAALVTRLEQLAEHEGVSMDTLFLTVFKLMLSKYAGHQDICVGSTVKGVQPGDKNMLDVPADTLVIRTIIDAENAFDVEKKDILKYFKRSQKK